MNANERYPGAALPLSSTSRAVSVLLLRSHVQRMWRQDAPPAVGARCQTNVVESQLSALDNVNGGLAPTVSLLSAFMAPSDGHMPTSPSWSVPCAASHLAR